MHDHMLYIYHRFIEIYGIFRKENPIPCRASGKKSLLCILTFFYNLSLFCLYVLPKSNVTYYKHLQQLYRGTSDMT